MIKFIVFDLDGTLVNTIGGIGNSCNEVLKSHNFSIHAINSYKDFVGYGLGVTIFKALPRDIQKQIIIESEEKNESYVKHKEVKNYVQELIKHYESHPTFDTNLYDGILDLLDQLKINNIKWGIHTNKEYSIAKKIAEELLSSKGYVGLKGPNHLTHRKPDPQGSIELLTLMEEKYGKVSLDEVLFVGDSEVDIETAKNLGVQVVAVSWGFRPGDFLEALNPDYLISKPMELFEIVKNLEIQKRVNES